MSQAASQCTDRLYREHHDWLFRWLRGRLGCENDAADLTHETYLRLLVSGRLPPTPAQSRPFLLQVARGLAVAPSRCWGRRALDADPRRCAGR